MRRQKIEATPGTRSAVDGGPRTAALPQPIRRALGRVRRRLLWAAMLRGVGLVALVATVGAGLGMGLDFAGALPQGLRWAIWGAWLVAVGSAIVLAILRPLVRGTSTLALAAVAERADPTLGERLTAAVALAGPRSPSSPPAHGSPALIAALAGAAAASAANVDPARAVSWRRPAGWCALGVAVLVLVTAPAAFLPATYGVLAGRFLAPWADLERVDRFVLSVAPGDGVAAIGAALTVKARIQPRFGFAGLALPESARLEWAETGGVWQTAAMPAEPPGSDAPAHSRSFAVTLPRLNGSLRYRVVSGSAASRSYAINAIEPPAVAAVEAIVEPPQYTRFPTATASDPGRIDAWEGSRVTLKVQASRPVQDITLEWPVKDEKKESSSGGRRVALPLALAADGKSGTATVAAEASGSFALSLRDGHGLSSRPEAESARRVIVRPDAPPVVAVKGAGEDAAQAQKASAADVLTLGVAARDDVAVAAVELHYAIERGPEAAASEGETAKGHSAVPLAGLGTAAGRGEARLALGSLGLKPGDTLVYRIRVADNRPAPAGPNVTWSPGRSLAIVAQAESLQARQSQAERARLQAKLDEVKRAAAANRRETEQLRYAADAVQRGNGRWEPAQQQALDRREAEARGVADRLQLLARDLLGAIEGSLRRLARPAQQIAEVEAESSRAMLDQARRAEQAASRLNDLRQADHRLAAVVQRLDELQREFDAQARRGADSQRLQELAAREEAIAAAEPDAAVDRLQAEQNEVQKDLEALLKMSPELRGEVLADEADTAAGVARQARALAERQRDLARRAGDVSQQGGTLKELAEAQRKLEEDARRLALDVDAPLVENGRGRLNTGLVHDAVEPIERGDLDQARQRIEGAEAELRRLARDLDTVRTDPRSIAHRLARRQDALNTQINKALRAFRDKIEPTADEKDAWAAEHDLLVGKQEAIAGLAAELALDDSPASKNAQAEEALRNARQSTVHALETLRNEALRTREITTQQGKAQAALNRLVAALPVRKPDAAPPDPAAALEDPELGLTPAETAAAEQLAVRQQDLRERLQALVAEPIPAQRELRAEAVALGAALTDLRDQSRPLSDRGRTPAQAAAQALGEQAPHAMDQGNQRLEQGQAAAAREAQRQAAALVERGAQQAEDLAAALRAERRPGPAVDPGSADPPRRPLARARAAMHEAAQELARAQSQSARQAMQHAARDLRAAAEHAPGAPAAPSLAAQAAAEAGEPTGNDPQAALARAGTPDLSELKAAVARTTGRAWGELPGHLRTEILQMSQGRYRDDYARLIQLYFREIASGAGRPE